MQLSDLNKTIEIIKTYNFKKNKNFLSITSNSKNTNKNTIFIYNQKSNVHNKYLNEAIKNKIPAIISNKYNKFLNIPQFIVSDIKLETEKLVKVIYKNLPYKTIAVTGTNGKTSVVWYLSQILTLLNFNNTTVGTLGHFINKKKISETSLTTPVYEELYKFGNSKKKNNIYIFESSSHALHQNRIRNYPINIAAITNISRDHLDYHKNMKSYKKEKIKLFTKYLLDNGTAIINSKIKNLLLLKRKLKNKKINLIFFGKNYIHFKNKDNALKLQVFKNVYNIKNLQLSTNIELENLECAIACCLALKIGEKKIIKILPLISNPPGRLQKINYNKIKSTIIIDYAHTPEALKNILKSYVSFNKKKPVLLFGCGGERDKSKRKDMGIIAKNFASRVYITDDNPRNENPSFIRKSIKKYCPQGIEVPNRKDAILKAINELSKNEILIIAGKGHEKYQILKNKQILFSDFEEVKKILKK